MKTFICVLQVILLVQLSFGQIESTEWLLSNNNIISFDENDEISVVDTAQNVPKQIEGTAMVANNQGDVIFTATSTTIYDSLWSVINNGDNLLGSPNGSSYQSPIILQKPGSQTEYYIFYLRGVEYYYEDQSLKYSIINICDETGEISIDENEKDIVFAGDFSERLELVEIDKNNYWLLASELSRKKLLAYKIDTSGIDMTPVTTWINFELDSNYGAMKINNAKDKLAWTSGYPLDEPGLVIYDFDVNTGVISNPEVVLIGRAIGLEWSQSDNYLYYTRHKEFLGVYAYNLSDGTIETLFDDPSYPYSLMGDLKLSPDKSKIIAVQQFNNKLGQITDIENGGTYSTLDLEFLGNLEMFTGLHERVINYGIQIPPEIVSNWDLIIKGGQDSTVLMLPDEFTNVVWSDGQTGNTAVFTEEGAYSVQANYECSLVNEEFIIERQKILSPDFNSTFTNIMVQGDVRTNDLVPSSTTYGSNPFLISKPPGAEYILSINNDGSYTFIADKVGVYTWEIPVCILADSDECIDVELKISVVDYLEPTLRPIVNTDIVSTAKETDVVIHSLENDRCAVVGTCALDPSTLTIVTDPSNGTVTVENEEGRTTYVPNSGFVGLDTVRYEVCVSGEPDNCAQADQIIMVTSESELNTTLAADDFNAGSQDTPLFGNVTVNDSDSEDDHQTVVAQTQSNEAGTLLLMENGVYTFLPNETFYGPVEFDYTICDDNESQACAKATLHILVLRDVYVQVRVYLQGALLNNGNEIGTHSRPLMRDDLRESSLTGERYIPDSEPYELLPVNIYWETAENAQVYEPFKKYGYDYSSVEDKFKIVPDPVSIFDDYGENSVVDWVSVELRNKNDFNELVASRSGLVQRDGDVMDLNGELGLRFKGLAVDDYYVVVRHRNHLGAMTAVAKTPQEWADLINFTVEETGFFDFGTTKNTMDYTGMSQANLSGVPASNLTGYKALWAGDFDGNGKVKHASPSDDLNNLFVNIFGYETDGTYNYSTNFNFAYGYLSGDFDLNSRSKFDAPNDDKNYLYGHLLFHPLNVNFKANFDLFIEQVPEAFILK